MTHLTSEQMPRQHGDFFGVWRRRRLVPTVLIAGNSLARHEIDGKRHDDPLRERFACYIYTRKLQSEEQVLFMSSLRLQQEK